ncbi:dityrosine transporter [Cryptococcus deuterogattii 99/473]|uniref:Dityrosine transporter n=1 Tax=Cryptococcus deuterogattii Ram5 TaxID=1296110 RepID=A0A0D0V519_9TREE|nr:dityrosine transporter [Cryptococcus deuterogattii Ram5]KIR72689.1 dityrosine transporter [Cryptococcus deuterogattii CA1014]KIY56056.1 dityrosine transporter [Cryptococcus deuterogattii 99/473]KNX50158.2 dityrosine transporter [Cryptococcus deuterogattii R265]
MVANNLETASSSSSTLMESSTLSAALAQDRLKEENGASKTLGLDSVPSISCSNEEGTALDENLRGKPPDREGDGGCAKLLVDTPRSEKEEITEVEMIDGRPKDIYDRFSKRQKIVIVAIISYSAFIAPMTSSIFLPSIPTMAVDLHSSAEVINYTVAIFLVTIGVASVFWSPYSGFYGRRPVYLASMPITVVASIGVAQSKNIGAIIGTRILQGIGSSCVLSVGAGTIGDIFRPTERSRGMATYYMGVLIGPALSPILGGIFTEYTSQTWRSAQYFLAGCSALSVVLTFFFLPETIHPPTVHERLKNERGKKFVMYWVNPFRSVMLLRWPNIAMACFISSCVMLDTYCVIIPLSAVFKDRYNIHNTAIAGCLYLVNGAGNVISSKIAGPYADRIVKKCMEKRGYRRPEDRLKASFWGTLILMPISVLIYGWLLKFGKGGMAPPLIMVFLNGISLMLCLTPLNTYLVDCMQSRSAEVVAINNCIRYIFSAAASAFVLPLANAIGWGWTMTMCAFVSWLAAGALFLLCRYGECWREAANIRYGITKVEAQEERADGGKDEEAAVVMNSTVEDRATEGYGEHLEGPVPMEEKISRTKSRAKAVDRQANRKAGELPLVEEVLKRQVSFSGPSIHGGG